MSCIALGDVGDVVRNWIEAWELPKALKQEWDVNLLRFGKTADRSTENELGEGL